MADEVLTCTPKLLPQDRWVIAAERAVNINPANRPMLERLSLVTKGFTPTKAAIAVVTSKYWHGGGVDLTVGFLDNPPAALRTRIILHMNAWAKTTNVRFRETKGQAEVRIARAADGYWSYLGTDILDIKPTDPTMNLEAFTMQTPESEFHRVVRHETGHTLGCPHEHMRRELVALIDKTKAYKYFLQTQGWNKNMVDQQVLTPIEESSLLGTVHADQNSIMCYQMPGAITKNGKPIIGGVDIDPTDFSFMATVYPKAAQAKAAKRAAAHLLRPRGKAAAKRKGTKRRAATAE